MASVGEIAAVCSRGGIRDDHIRRAISWGRCAHISPCANWVPVAQRSCVVCEILTAHLLAE